MISKRGLAAAAATGTGAVLLAAGAASACSLKDYHAALACDATLGEAAVTVTDDYPGYTAADLSVLDAAGTQVGSAVLAKDGRTVTIDVPWVSKGSWTVVVTVEDKQYSSADGELPTISTSQSTCGATPAPTPTPASPSASASSTAAVPAAAPTPSASASSTAVAAAAAPPASAVPTPTATLAETGSSGTGMVATLAGVLVAAGGGALYVLRRRPAGNRG